MRLLLLALVSAAVTAQPGLILLQLRAETSLPGDGHAMYSEDEYQKVAALHSNEAMQAFILNYLDNLDLQVKAGEQSRLEGLVPFYSGVKAVQSLAAMHEELTRAPWVEPALANLLEKAEKMEKAEKAGNVDTRRLPEVVDMGGAQNVINLVTTDKTAQGVETETVRTGHEVSSQVVATVDAARRAQLELDQKASEAAVRKASEEYLKARRDGIEEVKIMEKETADHLAWDDVKRAAVQAAQRKAKKEAIQRRRDEYLQQAEKEAYEAYVKAKDAALEQAEHLAMEEEGRLMKDDVERMIRDEANRKARVETIRHVQRQAERQAEHDALFKAWAAHKKTREGIKEEAERARENLVRSLFQWLDSNSDGVLDAPELYQYGVYTDFEGSYDAWEQEYQGLVQEFKKDVDYDVFNHLVNDATRSYAPDSDLQQILKDLEAHAT